jgi:DNA-binding NarL/FixJ family response regulator
LKPDLVSLDIGLSILNGLQAARQIRKLAPETKILLLRSSDGPELLHEAMTIGGRGRVAKSEAARDVLATVRAVLPDEHYFGRGFSPLGPPNP